MSEVATRYRRLAGELSRRVESVPVDRWESQSPCDEWTARDVLRHVIDVHGRMAGFASVTLPAGPSVDDDPVAAWSHTRQAMQETLDDPARAQREYDGVFGRTTLAATVDQFLCFDLIVHGWDIARATGIDETIPVQDLDAVEAFVEAMGDNIRQPGICGPAIPVSSDADQQARVLGLLGRTA